MEELLKAALMDTHGLLAYAAVLGVLIACGLGLPLPEDITLLSGGYLCHMQKAHLPLMMVVGFVGILAGDSIIYGFGRRFGKSKAGSRPTGFFARIVTPEKRARVQALFAKHGPKVVMIARFLPGVRAVTYFTAGSAGMRYRWFILFDGLAALVSAPAFVFLGWKFGDQMDLVLEKIKKGQVTVLIAVGALIAAYVAFSIYRKRRQKRADEALLARHEVVAARVNVGEEPHVLPPVEDDVAAEPGTSRPSPAKVTPEPVPRARV